MTFSTKKNEDFLEKRMILSLTQQKYMLNIEQFILIESKTVFEA